MLCVRVCVCVCVWVRARCVFVCEWRRQVPFTTHTLKYLRLKFLFTCLVNNACVYMYVSVSVSVSWGQTLELYRTGIKNPLCWNFQLLVFLFMCLKRGFVVKYHNCISKRLSKGFFFKLKFDIQQWKKCYLHRMVQKSLDVAVVLLNIENQVTLAPVCMLFIAVCYTIHVSGLHPRRYRSASCPHLGPDNESQHERFESCTFQINIANVTHWTETRPVGLSGVRYKVRVKWDWQEMQHAWGRYEVRALSENLKRGVWDSDIKIDL